MRLTIFTEPQLGATYDDQLRVARHAHATGFEGFFRSDHYLAFSGDGLPGPTDSWVTLAGLARETEVIRLGTLVTSATFRLPGPLAISVAEVDAMSAGRVELGLGAGWFESEHQAYGVPFPSLAERFGRLEEQLAVITGLWSTPVGERFSFHGTWYDVTDSPGLPKPVQTPRPPIIVGGRGARRTPALAARYAAEFNVPFSTVAETARTWERVVAACEAAGRDVATLTLSAAQTICCGRDDAEIARRVEAIGLPIDQLREQGLCGTPQEVVDQIGAYAELGVSRLHLQVIDLSDLDHLDLIATAVAPQLP